MTRQATQPGTSREATTTGRVATAREPAAGVSGPVRALAVWLAAVGGLVLLDGTVPVGRPLRYTATCLAVFALGAILAALTARPLTLRQSLIRLKLGPWVCVSFGVVFGLASLVWLAPVPLDDLQRAAVDPGYLVPALLTATLGLACLCIGYEFAPRALGRTVAVVDASLRGAPGAPIRGRAIVALWSVAALAQATTMVTGSFGYLSNPEAALATTSSLPAVLALLTDLGLLASLLAGWHWAVARTAASLSLLLFVLASQLALGLFAGMKEIVIIHLFAACFGYGSRRRVRVAPVLVAGLAIVVFVVPFITQYRAEVLTGSGRLSPSEVVEVVVLDDLLSSTTDASVVDSSEQLVQRLARVGDVAVVLQKTPSLVAYESPVELVAGPFLGVVPRSVWPQKPVLEAGYVMSTVYYGIPPEIYTASAMTPYGDLWRHGGLGVLALGMALLGVLLRTIDDRPGDPSRDPRLLFLPMLLFTPLVKHETDFLALVASLAGIVLIAALGSRLVTATSGYSTRPRRPPSAAAVH